MLEENLKELNVVYVADNAKRITIADIFNTDIERENEYTTKKMINELSKVFKSVTYYDSPQKLMRNVHKHKNDIVFPYWFGKNSRNRKALVPAICESSNLKYIGPDTHLQSLGNDKYLSKLYVSEFDIETPYSILLHKYCENYVNEVLEYVEYPVIVKPNFEGNSIGISDKSVAYNKEECKIMLKKLFKVIKDSVLIEQFLPGPEIEIFMLGNKNEIKVIDEREILVNSKTYLEKNLFGFESKVNKSEYEMVSSNYLDHSTIEKLKRVFFSFQKAEYIRFDGKYMNNQFYLFEISPDCSLIENSNLDLYFKDQGCTYEDTLKAIFHNHLYQAE